MTFLRQLKKNNDREWFKERKPIFDQELIAPSKQFIASISKPLRSLVPTLQISPRSLSRIYRDMRFATDALLYLTYLSFMFKDSRRRTDLSPRFYFEFDPTGLAFGAGIFQFSISERERFRLLITECESAELFTKIIK
ncbi:MAG: DUF2461 family protein [Xanthomonadaceae bacterium]|nr:DUF2461 family protein [Xanthomonadaceae bacterium]